MATNFPSSLDSFTNPTAVDTLDSPPHDTQHADANDAIEALQAKVGVNGSAVTTSLDYKVANLESRPVETKTASYVLVAGDVNKRIVMNNAGATTITVNDSVFAAGDTVWIHNIGAGTTTVTAGTATVDTAGSLDVGQWEGGSLYFTSASSAIFFRGGGAGVANANFTDTETGTFTEGGVDYKYLIFTSSGTVTFDTDGIADFLVVAGGGGGNTWRTTNTDNGAGGGAGGVIDKTGVYVTAGTYTVTVGAGGPGTYVQPYDALGNDSSVGTLLQAVGGGGGGTSSSTDTADWGARVHGWGGGSGGGAGQAWGTNAKGGRGVSGQGSDGGNYAVGGGHGIAAGGGGWGGTGGPVANATPANGGPGNISTIVTSTIATANSIGEVSGSDVYYGGGGAGKAKVTTYNGTGGIGGGGDIATAGAANTGGGGGGSNTLNTAGGSGGSGLVIVRVAV